MTAHFDDDPYVEPVTLHPAVAEAAWAKHSEAIGRGEVLQMLFGDLGPVRHRDTAASERSARRRARRAEA